MSKTIAYLRVSTDDQSNGLEVQRQEIARWAAARGVVVAEWFTDRGVSGTAAIEKRPALLDALAALGRGDTLVIQKRDRLARDVLIATMVDRSVAKAKASLACAQGGDGSSPSDVLMRQILDAVSQFEVALIRARTKAACSVKRSQGRAHGVCPFGMRNDGGMLVEDAGEQLILVAIRRALSDGLSEREIVVDLAAAGHVARSGKPLAKTQVHRIAAAVRAA